MCLKSGHEADHVRVEPRQRAVLLEADRVARPVARDALVHMVEFDGSGFHIGMDDLRGDDAVAVQVFPGDGFQHGLRLRVQLQEPLHRDDGVQRTEQVQRTLHDEDDADGHDQRFHGAEGVEDHDDAQHDAQHGQQQEAFPAGILALAQLQCVLDAAQTVEDDEQAEDDGQDAHHDVAANDEECTQPQTDQTGDQGQLALEDTAK